MALTIEQQRALALAKARRLREEQQQAPEQPDFTAPTTETYDASAEEMMSGVPYIGMPSESGIDQAAGGFIRGAAYDPAAAVAQIVGGQRAREAVAASEAGYQEMRQQRGDEGFEFSRLAGNILSPVNIAAGAAGVRGAQALGLGGLGQAAAAGAATGVVQPLSTEPSDLATFISDKTQQVGVSAVLGLLTQAGITGASKVGKFVRDLTAPITTAGRERLLRQKLQDLSKADREKIADALSRADEIVPGSRPTAGEALANVPEAVELQALQQRLSRQPGVAPMFAARQAEQQAARQAQLGPGVEAIPLLEARRAAVTSPMREEALAQANVAGRIVPRLEEEIAQRQAEAVRATQMGGQFQGIAAEQGQLATQPFTPVAGFPRVSSRYRPNIDRAAEAMDAAKAAGNVRQQRLAEADFKKIQLQSLSDEGFYPLQVDPLVNRLDSLLDQKTIQASDLKTRTFQDLRNKLLQLSDDRGIIDSNALYEVRKQIGDSVRKFADETKTADQRVLAGLETSLKGLIDNQIEKAGGVSWKDYLKNYADYSQQINRIQIGNYLRDKLGGSVDDVERAGAFKAAVDNAASTIKRASGASRFTELGEVLTKEQTAAVNSVLADVQRKAKSQAAGRSAFSARELEESPELPQLLDRTAVLTNAVIRALKSDANEELNRRATELFLDPKQLGILISSVPKSKANQFIDALYSRLSPKNQEVLNRLLAVQPVVSGTMQPEEQQ